MNELSNPADAGPFEFESVVYAAPGLDYTPPAPALDAYLLFQTPAAGYETRRVDISLFAEFDSGVPWTFANTNAPLNGIARIPVGDGPFPLVLFAHGNHDPFENSTPGYIYLCELLASHGVVAATIDVNFLNGFNRGENDGRAIIKLEHIKQFVEWNNTPGHPLNGKIDESQIAIAGHSRGGEAVGHASLFNTLTVVQPDSLTPPVPLDGTRGLGPYNFSLKVIVAIAPTDGQYEPMTGPTKVLDNYFVFHGARDGDVVNFPGYLTYDRSHPVDLAHPDQPAAGFKTLLWIYGANHNFFNTVWGEESIPTGDIITRDQQESVAKVYVSAIVHSVLLNKPDYLALFKDHSFGADEGWLAPDITVVSQYQDPSRCYVQHFQEPGAAIALAAPLTGSVNSTGISVDKLVFDLGPESHLFQETVGAQVTWNGAGGEYRINFSPAFNPVSFPVFALRAGQSFEGENPLNADQDFSIVFKDGSTQVSLDASSINRLAYPAEATFIEQKTVMQTLRIPLQQLEQEGLNVSHITGIGLIFNRTDRGRIYLDDIQFTQ